MKFISINLLLVLVVLGIAACSDGGHSSEDATWKHLGSSIKYKNQATQLGNAGRSPAVIDAEVMGEMKRLWQLALDEARQVDASILNSDEPSFGDRYKNEFQRGLELLVEAQSNDELIRGQVLLRKFGAYFQDLRDRRTSK